MDFLTFMRALLALQDATDGMTWDVNDGVVTIEAPVSEEVEQLLRDGRRMFEPA